MSKQFKNKNGLTYEIIKQNGNYSLLQCKETKQFVVAWFIGEDSWCQGYYFDEPFKERAFAFYNRKTEDAA